MPEPLIDELEMIATREEISFNQLVIQCCEYALHDLEKEKEKDRKEE